MILTDVWCSSGSVNSHGSLIQTGGDTNGLKVVRTMDSCNEWCDWVETKDAFLAQRWYASVQKLPSDEEIIIGGRRQFNFEFYPKSTFLGLYSVPFLSETNDKGIENNLYPFTFVNTNENIFMFANNRAILLDHKNNVIVKRYPTIPGGDPRSYPSTGSAAFLPLRNIGADNIVTEILVCGGAPKGSYAESLKGNFVRALDTCARLKINDATPSWKVESMSYVFLMEDMTLLPNGDILITNRAGKSVAGWKLADDAVLNLVIYHPLHESNSRFESLNSAQIARMYLCTVILLRDGRALVDGSNSHKHYKFDKVKFPTEVSLDTFSPSYLDAGVANLRPTILLPVSEIRVDYAQQIKVRFTIPGSLELDEIVVTMIAPTFTTHSFSMNQRLLVLTKGDVRLNLTDKAYEVSVLTPKSGVLAPPGFYFLFVVHKDVPSITQWIRIQ